METKGAWVGGEGCIGFRRGILFMSTLSGGGKGEAFENSKPLVFVFLARCERQLRCNAPMTRLAMSYYPRVWGDFASPMNF
jgi:hypothetical protein